LPALSLLKKIEPLLFYFTGKKIIKNNIKITVSPELNLIKRAPKLVANYQSE